MLESAWNRDSPRTCPYDFHSRNLVLFSSLPSPLRPRSIFLRLRRSWLLTESRLSVIPIDFSTDDTRFTFFYSIFSFFGIFRVISLNRSLSTIRLLSLLSYFAFSERVILNRIAKIPVHAVIVPSLETMHS